MKYIISIIATFLPAIALATPFTLQSSDLKPGSKIATEFTCDGKNISPQLAWQHPPAKVKSYALIVSDPDAPGGTFHHWIIFNIPLSINELARNTTPPAGTITGKNSFGTMRYQGPCPPKGSHHRYFFQLNALDSTLPLDQNADAMDIINAMQQHVLAVSEIEVTYGH